MPVEEKKYRDEEWLRRKVEEGKSTYDIADTAGCSQVTVLNWTQRFGIETAKQPGSDNPEHLDRMWLLHRYLWDWMTIAEVAEEAGVTPAAVRHKMRDFGIPTRDPAEVNRRRNNFVREDNPNWGGGYSDDWRYTTEWTRARSDARERDGHECQECGSGDIIHVHHIEPVSEGGAKHDLDNLVTLCRTCHFDAHS